MGCRSQFAWCCPFLCFFHVTCFGDLVAVFCCCGPPICRFDSQPWHPLIRFWRVVKNAPLYNRRHSLLIQGRYSLMITFTKFYVTRQQMCRHLQPSALLGQCQEPIHVRCWVTWNITKMILSPIIIIWKYQPSTPHYEVPRSPGIASGHSIKPTCLSLSVALVMQQFMNSQRHSI